MLDGSETSSLLYVLAAGLLIGFVAGIVVSGANSAPLDDSTLPTSVSSGGPSCYDGPRENVGWLHVIASGERWTTTLNATVVHPRGTDVTVNVSQRQPGDYEIALETVQSNSLKFENESCRAATTVNVATDLPDPDFVVTMNGRPVREVDQEETTANLYPLPNPINATD